MERRFCRLTVFSQAAAALLLLGACGSGPAKPTLVGLPDCGTPSDGGTAEELNDEVLVNTACGASGCHSPPAPFSFDLSDGGAAVRSEWVGKKSTQVPELNRVTPGDVNASYLIYKLVGQQADAGGLGDRMPQGGPYLDDVSLCRVINWVKTGAR
jgi:hypothetical protein